MAKFLENIEMFDEICAIYSYVLKLKLSLVKQKYYFYNETSKTIEEGFIFKTYANNKDYF